MSFSIFQVEIPHVVERSHVVGPDLVEGTHHCPLGRGIAAFLVAGDELVEAHAAALQREHAVDCVAAIVAIEPVAIEIQVNVGTVGGGDIALAQFHDRPLAIKLRGSIDDSNRLGCLDRGSLLDSHHLLLIFLCLLVGQCASRRKKQAKQKTTCNQLPHLGKFKKINILF